MAGRKGKSVDSPNNMEASRGKYWSIGAMSDGGPETSSVRNDGEIRDGIGSVTEPGGDTRHDGTDREPSSHPPPEGERPPTQGPGRTQTSPEWEALGTTPASRTAPQQGL